MRGPVSTPSGGTAMRNERTFEGGVVGGVHVPPYMLRTFNGSFDTLETMRQQAWGDRGERSMLVRQLTEDVVGDLRGKDYLSELLAIRNFACGPRIRYLNDPAHVELIKDPERIVKEVLERGRAQIDCDEIAELITTMGMQAGREMAYVVVGFEVPHDYSHVFSTGKEPKTSKWLILDPVAGTEERQMSERVTTWARWSLDDDSPGPHEVFP